MWAASGTRHLSAFTRNNLIRDVISCVADDWTVIVMTSSQAQQNVSIISFWRIEMRQNFDFYSPTLNEQGN